MSASDGCFNNSFQCINMDLFMANSSLLLCEASKADAVICMKSTFTEHVTPVTRLLDPYFP